MASQRDTADYMHVRRRPEERDMAGHIAWLVYTHPISHTQARCFVLTWMQTVAKQIVKQVKLSLTLWQSCLQLW